MHLRNWLFTEEGQAVIKESGYVPHADPWELKESTGPNKTVQWYANTPYKDDIPEHRKRILNGFTAVTFTENDVVERYINQKGHVEFEI